jgi:hypothetical protein
MSRSIRPADSPLFRRGLYSLTPASLILFCLAGIVSDAQNATTVPTPDKNAIQQGTHPNSSQPQASASQTAASSELSQWPANQQPVPAAFQWNGRTLQIAAQNASLQQILEKVAVLTGAKIEGNEIDQRVYGVYGPGRVSDVLAALLQGSGYNVLLIGDQGQGVPRRIVLSMRPTGPTSAPIQSTQASRDESEDIEPEIPHGSPQEVLQRMKDLRQGQRQPTQPNPNAPQDPPAAQDPNN